MGALGNNAKGSANGQSLRANLTPRELQVLQHIGRGFRNSEVARAMGIAPKTVEAHLERILRKLGARNRTQAVIHALQMGWLQQSIPG